MWLHDGKQASFKCKSNGGLQTSSITMHGFSNAYAYFHMHLDHLTIYVDGDLEFVKKNSHASYIYQEVFEKNKVQRYPIRKDFKGIAIVLSVAALRIYF